jgi:hypothetical protein
MSSGRLSGRVDNTAASLQTTTATTHPNARESLRSRAAVTTRVTDASVRRLTGQLTPIDYCVLEALKTIHIATGAQLRRLYWADTDTGKRLARHRLAKLTKLRLIARLDRRIGGVRAGSDGYTYALDVAGLRVVADGTAIGRQRRPSTPGDRYLVHALAVTDRFVDITELESAHAFEVLAFEAEPASWRTYSTEHGRQLTIKPDAFILVADDQWEHSWFIEVDRATEHRPTILRKAADYIRYWQSGVEQAAADVFPQVLWVTPDKTRADRLTDWLHSLDRSTADIFQVCTDTDFTITITSAVKTSGAIE